MYIRVSQKIWKFCDRGKMMGEVFITSFYFYYFYFRQLLDNYSTQIPNIALMVRICNKECRWNLRSGAYEI